MEVLTNLCDKITIEDEDDSGLVIEQKERERGNSKQTEVVSGREVLNRQSDQLSGNEDDTIGVMEIGKGSIYQRHQIQPLLIPILSQIVYGESYKMRAMDL